MPSRSALLLLAPVAFEAVTVSPYLTGARPGLGVEENARLAALIIPGSSPLDSRSILRRAIR
jgi:hypothetical protein